MDLCSIYFLVHMKRFNAAALGRVHFFFPTMADPQQHTCTAPPAHGGPQQREWGEEGGLAFSPGAYPRVVWIKTCYRSNSPAVGCKWWHCGQTGLSRGSALAGDGVWWGRWLPVPPSAALSAQPSLDRQRWPLNRAQQLVILQSITC